MNANLSIKANINRLVRESPHHESHVVRSILPHPSPLPHGEGELSTDDLKQRTMAAIHGFNARTFLEKSFRSFSGLHLGHIRLRRQFRVLAVTLITVGVLTAISATAQTPLQGQLVLSPVSAHE